MKAKQPTAQQIAALQSFAKANRRNWKQRLNYYWTIANYDDNGDTHILQQIRNEFGPTWLTRFKLPPS